MKPYRLLFIFFVILQSSLCLSEERRLLCDVVGEEIFYGSEASLRPYSTSIACLEESNFMTLHSIAIEKFKTEAEWYVVKKIFEKKCSDPKYIKEVSPVPERTSGYECTKNETGSFYESGLTVSGTVYYKCCYYSDVCSSKKY